MKNLVRFLSHSEVNVLSNDLELAKLWKGILYRALTRLLSLDHPKWCLSCLGRRLWMSDRPLVQRALAAELAGILLKIPDPSSSLLFLKGFWQTAVREWHGIDRPRYAGHALGSALSLRLTFRVQDGQVLHVDSALRPADREPMGSTPLPARNTTPFSPLWAVPCGAS